MTNEVEAVEVLEQRLGDAVRLQSLADVPLGAFLSGGVDSATIVALVQRQATRPVRTFTVGFEAHGFDESPYARAVAKHLGTDHTRIMVAAAEALAVIARLLQIHDEPFADSSQVSTHVVGAAARAHVTVALSGDGGDEMFAGYNRYYGGPQIWLRINCLPSGQAGDGGGRSFLCPRGGMGRFGPAAERNAGYLQRRDPEGRKGAQAGASMRVERAEEDFYLSLVSEWQDPAEVVRGEADLLRAVPGVLEERLPASGMQETSLRMMYRDSITYLPDDILCKVDRAALAVGLETRVPFLDHRVAQAAWRLPLNMRIRKNPGKWALRQVLDRHVPRELVERPKAGFALPLGLWLRGPLRAWAETLLDPVRPQKEGYFHAEPIRRNWADHVTGSRDHTAALWSVLMFQAWLENVS